MKIGIVGLGLIGGSIFKKVSEKYDVIGVSRSVTGSNITQSYESLKNCDIIFVCVPMNKTLDVLDKLNSILDKNTIVADVCSLKEFVSEKRYNFTFIPSHPMAGTENSGWASSFPELFQGAVWAVTPLEDTDEEALKKLKEIIVFLGAEPLETSPQEHDKAVALISHMPMLIAQALCKNIEDNILAQKLASSGFRDTTRLALSNIEMAVDMVNMNNKNIQTSLELLKNSVNTLLKSNYQDEAEKIKAFRQELYDSKASR